VEEEQHAALDELAAELVADDAPKTVLMCLEDDAKECHRHVLAQRLGDRVPGLRVVDL
jgi:uncharacterized protein (DUF488 family)